MDRGFYQGQRRPLGAGDQYVLVPGLSLSLCLIGARAYLGLSLQNRWIAIAMGLATHLFTGLLTIYLVYFRHEGPALTGWTIAAASSFSSNILWFVH